MRIALALALCLSTMAVVAQLPETGLEKVREKYSGEKIYLHYDKSFYAAGETIWFKAYLMDGYMPSTRSTVLCVELLSDTGKLIEKKILPIAGSSAVGDFKLPANLPGGEYVVKAYTRYLMNFGFDAFYYEHLNIFNPAAGTEIKPANLITSTELHFLPESGNLIYNIVNNVAFKCTDAYGQPLDVEGKIIDANGKEQTTFKSSHNGMGHFLFLPRSGETYRADCIINGAPKVLSLPAPIAEGVMLNINKRNDKTMFTLDASTVVNPNLVPAYILGVEENMVVFKVPVPENAKRLNGEIPVAQLPTGILQLTVFNKQDKPIAERVMFINSGDYIPEGSFKTEKKNLAARAENTFSFQLKDTVPGTFSVSVTDGGINYQHNENIISRLLLTAELKGRVYKPAYYFEENDAVRQEHLDLVMLTHGWRRYTWNEILNERFPTLAFKDPDFVTIAGEAFHPTTQKPLVNTGLTIVAKTSDKNVDFLKVTTDAEGKFVVPGLTFEDSATFVLQANNTKNARLLARNNAPGLSNLFRTPRTNLPKFFLDARETAAQAAFTKTDNFSKLAKFNGIVLDEITVQAKTKSQRQRFEEKRVTGSLGSMPAKTLDFITDPPNSDQNVFNYLQGRLSGVRISGGPINYSIIYRNAMSLSSGPIPMIIYLDEIQVDASQISTMRISDIALINVYSSGGLAGGAGGALAIYTKRGDGSARAEDMTGQTLAVEGFSSTKEFYSPNYSVAGEDKVETDERTTLYWNPYIVTNAENKAVLFSFHNSDKTKKFKVVLEGMLSNGKLLRIEKMIE